MTATITAVFPDGTQASRITEAAYTHAARRSPGARVTFHFSRGAAHRAAGQDGQVVPVTGATASPEEVPQVPTCDHCGQPGGIIAPVTGHPEVGQVHGRCIRDAVSS